MRLTMAIWLYKVVGGAMEYWSIPFKKQAAGSSKRLSDGLKQSLVRCSKSSRDHSDNQS